MAKYKVTNDSRNTVHRLSYRFEPKKSITVELSDSELLAVRSARALSVEKVSDDAELTGGDYTIGTSAQKLRESTIQEVLEMIANGEMEASEALQLEKDGKNRDSLIKELETIAWGVQTAENKGDYSLESETEITDVEGAKMKAQSEGSPVAVPTSQALASNQEGNNDVQSNISNMTVKEVLNEVENGNISVDDALKYEREGKHRNSLIRELEEMHKNEG